jgi:hypothetical protein
MGIQTKIHRTLMWAALSTLLLVPCLGIVIVIRPWLENLPSWTMWLFGSVLLILTIFYFRAIYPVIDHLFQQGSQDLQTFSQKLAERLTVGNVQKLEREMTQILTEALSVDSTYLLLLDEKKKGYYPVVKNGTGADTSITADDFFIQWICHHLKVIEAKTFQENSFSPQVKEASAAYFTRSNATVCIPLQKGSSLLGIVHLGSKIDRQPFNEIDLQFLERFRVEGSLALERLYMKREETV